MTGRIIFAQILECEMTDPSVVSEQQLRRQISWLKESWSWLLRTRVLGPDPQGHRLEALDVGCGPGLVMEELGSLFNVQGLDRDEGMVEGCLNNGFRAVQGVAEGMPFEDGSFDVVYCSFLLLWVKDPSLVVREMRRVSRRWVVCLAEPDYGGRIDHPEGLGPLRDIIIDGLLGSGADPLMGRKLRDFFHRAGLEAEVGVHPGVWSTERLASEGIDEWCNIANASGLGPAEVRLREMELVWKKALDEGSLFQFSPIFYALARK
jgi:SAM-dependent methyltransferase